MKKSFKVRGKEIAVLKVISFSILPGEIVTITGRSGEGKSVLLWLLGGLDKPDTGEIMYKERSITNLTNHSLAQLRRNEIGMILQNFNLIASWTALENVESALRQCGLATEKKR